jgi:hypothetical protein
VQNAHVGPAPGAASWRSLPLQSVCLRESLEIDHRYDLRGDPQLEQPCVLGGKARKLHHGRPAGGGVASGRARPGAAERRSPV